MNRDLLQKRAKAIADARAIHERGEAEKRALTPEEEQQYNAFLSEAESLLKRSQRGAALEGLTANLDETDGDESGSRPEPEAQRQAEPPANLRACYRDALAQMREAGDQRATPEYQRSFRGFLNGAQVRGISKTGEHRDLQNDIDPQGGYLKAPPQFVAGLLQAVDDLLYIRQWATVHTLGAADELTGVSLDADPDEGEWTSEIGAITYDASTAFGKRALHPHVLAKGIKLSRKLLRTAPNAENIVIDRLRYRMAVPMEKKYLLGTGVNQPLGLFTASTDGISTARDVSTDNTTTAITFDGLINAKYSLKAAYWPKAKWLFHRDAVKMLTKIKNAVNGEYIWEPSVTVGAPDMLLGSPVYASEYVPNTFTTGLYVGIYGDFSYYWIADALNMEMQRVIELYSATRQIGIHAWLETDGMPVLAEAFARVKLA